jgi:hypothetical protein
LRLVLWDFLEEESTLKSELKKNKKLCLKRAGKHKQLYAELGKIGSNINQIARALNSMQRDNGNQGREEIVKKYWELVVETLDLVSELKLKLRED